jgi:hypothetical protein
VEGEQPEWDLLTGGPVYADDGTRVEGVRLAVSGVIGLVDMDSRVCLSHLIVNGISEWIVSGDICMRFA